MRDDTKLAQIREAMAAADWDQVLRIAGKFPRLGEHAEAITRAANAVSNPGFYQELGYDLEVIRQAGINAVKARFDKSWESAKSETENDDRG